MVTFDESVSYEDLLRLFWREHSPNTASRQYRSAIFYHTEDQKAIAEAMRESTRPDCRHTNVEAASAFYRAEEYHQSYLKKQTDPLPFPFNLFSR